MEPVSVFVGDQFEAALIEGALKEQGIQYLKQSEHGAGFILRAGGMLESFHIFVAPQDVARAEEIIDRLEIGEQTTDPSDAKDTSEQE